VLVYDVVDGVKSRHVLDWLRLEIMVEIPREDDIISNLKHQVLKTVPQTGLVLISVKILREFPLDSLGLKSSYVKLSVAYLARKIIKAQIHDLQFLLCKPLKVTLLKFFNSVSAFFNHLEFFVD